MLSIKELKSEKHKFKNDYSKFVEISNLLGHKYRELGRYSDATNEHLDSIQACEKIKNKIISLQLRAVSYRALGECYSEMSMHVEALMEHNRFLSLTLEMNDLIEIQRAHATIGRTYLLWALDTDNKRTQRSILNKSISSFQKALELCENLMSSGKLKVREYADMKSRLLLNIGLVHENLGDYDKCKPLLFDSIQLTKANFLYDEHFRCQISLGSIYEKLNSFDDALQCYEQALDTGKMVKSKVKQVDALICLGLITMKQSNVHKARKFFKKAFLLGTPVDDDRQKVARLLKISSLIRDDLVCLEQNVNCPEKSMLVCDRLGDHFVEIKCFDLAINYYKKELFYATETNQADSVLANIYVSIGQTYLDDGNYVEAINYFQHEYNFNFGNKCEQCKSLLKIADIQECLCSNIDELELEERAAMRKEIVSTYNDALNLFDFKSLIRNDSTESSQMKCNELKLYVQAAKNYLNFLEANHLDSNQQEVLQDNLSKLNVTDNEEIEDEIDVDSEDLYESYNLDLLSSDSDRSFAENEDEEIPENFQSRPRRSGKSSKVTNRLNQFGETPLHTACISGNISQVERLIEQKANINAKDYCGWTPLHEACNHGYLEIVDCLIRNGANMQSCDERSDRITALHDACNCGHFSIIRLLLKHGASVLALTTHNETPLECLMNWRQRTVTELTSNELNECLQLEDRIKQEMKEKGFDLNRLGNVYSKTRNETTTNKLRRNLLDTDIYSTANRLGRSSDENDDKKLDYENPTFTRKEYQNAIQSFRRNRLTSNRGFNGGGGGSGAAGGGRATKSALISDNVVRDDWLIDDLGKSRNNSRKRDKDDHLYGDTKKMRTSSLEEDIFPDNYLNEDDYVSEFFGSPNKHPISIDDDQDDVQIVSRKRNEPRTLQTTIEPVESEAQEKQQKRNNVASESTTSINNEVVIEKIDDFTTKVATVYFDDVERSTFGVPIKDVTVNCKSLIDEVCKRYFHKYGIKPIISLKTLDGASLSDDDLITSNIGVNESVNATISSWIIEPADQRYNELCMVNELEMDETIESCLKLVNISGLFKITNSFISSNRHIQILFQTLFRQEIKELDISYTNILDHQESYQAFQRTLCSLSTLESLNLCCVCYPTKCLLNLLNISPALKRLDLSFNTITDDNTYTIAQIIKCYNKLEQLNLIGCDLTETFVRNKLLISSLQNSNLKMLLLDHNDIDGKIVDKFKALEQNRLFLNDL